MFKQRFGGIAEGNHADEDCVVIGSNPQRRGCEVTLCASAANGVGDEAAGCQDVEAHGAPPSWRFLRSASCTSRLSTFRAWSSVTVPAGLPSRSTRTAPGFVSRRK